MVLDFGSLQSVLCVLGPLTSVVCCGTGSIPSRWRCYFTFCYKHCKLQLGTIDLFLPLDGHIEFFFFLFFEVNPLNA